MFRLSSTGRGVVFRLAMVIFFCLTGTGVFGPTGTGIFGGEQPAEGHSWCPQRRMGVVTPLVVQCKLGAGPEKKAGCYVSQSMFRAIVLFLSLCPTRSCVYVSVSLTTPRSTISTNSGL